MKNKDKIIRDILFKIRQIVDTHLSIEDQPLHFNDGIVVSPKEIKTIQAIGKSNKINIKELGDYFNTSKSAASQIISKLVKKGFVLKEKPIENNKEFKLTLTESGKQVFTIYQNFYNSHIKDITQTLTSTFNKNELSKSYELLELIERKMKKQIDKIV